MRLMDMSRILSFIMSIPRSAWAFLRGRTKKQIILSLVSAVVIWYGYGYFFGNNDVETRYILNTVEKRTVVASVSASGQISSSNLLDVKSKAGGEIISLRVEAGDTVRAGQVVAVLDSTDAQKAVRDASANLESANIALAKIKKPASALTLTQAENSLINAQDSLAKTYTDSRTHVTNVFLDLPSTITTLESTLLGTDLFASQWNVDFYKNAIEQYDTRVSDYRNVALEDFRAAKKSYELAFVRYQSFPITPSNQDIEEMVALAYTAIESTQKASRSANALITFYQDTMKGRNLVVAPGSNTALTNINSFTGKINTHFLNLIADANALKQYRQTIAERQQNIDDIKSGADDLDIQSAELSVRKAQNALLDARTALSDYTVTAPFDGVISKVAVKRRETVGNGTLIATVVSPQQIAELSLNEVDAAKIKVGNKASLTFDALEELSLTGKVAHIDPVGTVSQGVVSYIVQIKFDTQDERVKPSMTVNAAIITAVQPDVLTVPMSSIKNQGGRTSVQVFIPAYIPPPITDTDDATATNPQQDGITTEQVPESVSVQVGISDDAYTEITSGLTEGQQIIERVIAPKAAAAAPSLFSPPGQRGGQGGARPAGNAR
ncbi:MAG: hypothetical protein RI911_668 [Candidatus Parcubacteria bacterium]